MPKFNDIKGSWSLDEGYVDQGFNAYPQRSILSSARNAIMVFMMGFEHNFDYTCRSFKQGYKVSIYFLWKSTVSNACRIVSLVSVCFISFLQVFLNSPESVPLTTGNYILVPHDNEVIVSVLPHYITSSENLHQFGPDK